MYRTIYSLIYAKLSRNAPSSSKRNSYSRKNLEIQKKNSNVNKALMSKVAVQMALPNYIRKNISDTGYPIVDYIVVVPFMAILCLYVDQESSTKR